MSDANIQAWKLISSTTWSHIMLNSSTLPNSSYKTQNHKSYFEKNRRQYASYNQKFDIQTKHMNGIIFPFVWYSYVVGPL